MNAEQLAYYRLARVSSKREDFPLMGTNESGKRSQLIRWIYVGLLSLASCAALTASATEYQFGAYPDFSHGASTFVAVPFGSAAVDGTGNRYESNGSSKGVI